MSSTEQVRGVSGGCEWVCVCEFEVSVSSSLIVSEILSEWAKRGGWEAVNVGSVSTFIDSPSVLSEQQLHHNKVWQRSEQSLTTECMLHASSVSENSEGELVF